MPPKHLIIDGARADDIWRMVEDDAPLTEAASIISYARFLDETKQFRTRNAPLGVLVRAGGTPAHQLGDDVRAFAPSLSILDMVALEFPNFRNGRGFSSARILREELRFMGEIRAVGEVLYDQLQFMQRCGINSFEIDATISPADFAMAVDALSYAYQPPAHKQASIIHKRHKH